MTFARNGLTYTVTDPAHVDAFRAAGWDEVNSVPVCLPDLQAMTKAQLLEYAKTQGITVDTRANKAAVIAAIEGLTL